MLIFQPNAFVEDRDGTLNACITNTVIVTVNECDEEISDMQASVVTVALS